MTTIELTAVTDLDQICVDTIRMLSMDAVQRAKLGEAIGMHNFRASAPASSLYRHVGITPERVAQSGMAPVNRARAEGRR